MLLIPRDKILHALAGAALFLLGHWLVGPWVGALLCTGIGAAKEAWDRLSGIGSASLADFLATLAGGAIAAAVLMS